PVPVRPAAADPASTQMPLGRGRGQADRRPNGDQPVYRERIHEANLPALRRPDAVRAAGPLGEAGVGGPMCLGRRSGTEMNGTSPQPSHGLELLCFLVHAISRPDESAVGTGRNTSSVSAAHAARATAKTKSSWLASRHAS